MEKWHYMQVAGSEKKTNVKGFALDFISISGKIHKLELVIMLNTVTKSI